MDNSPESSILAEGVMHARTGEGLVRITWGTRTAIIDVSNARELAQNILHCAEASESDAAIFAFLTAEIGLPVEEAGQFIGGLRAHRETNTKGKVP